MTSANFNKLDKSMLDAMRDSNYFKRQGKPDTPIESGSPELNKKFKNNSKSFFGDSKGFLDNFKEGVTSNLKEAKEKSDTDKYLDFLSKNIGEKPMFGDFGGGGFEEVAEGFSYGRIPSQTQQMLIPGQEGKPGLFNVRGAIGGGIKGFMAGGPAGALGGGLVGGFTS